MKPRECVECGRPVIELRGQFAFLLVHPEALEGSLFHRERSLQAEWGPEFVSAIVEYGVFVPAALEPYVSRAR